MDNTQLLEAIKAKMPDAVLESSESFGDLSIIVKKDSWVDLCRSLREDPQLDFDFLTDLCAVDYPQRTPRFDIVVHLYSLKYKHRLRLKTAVADGEKLESLTSVWVTANWHEREAYDLMGISFTGHPNLERILTPEDWTVHPLRKEYTLRGDKAEVTSKSSE